MAAAALALGAGPALAQRSLPNPLDTPGAINPAVTPWRSGRLPGVGLRPIGSLSGAPNDLAARRRFFVRCEEFAMLLGA
jgi:hypothetical protein